MFKNMNLGKELNSKYTPPVNEQVRGDVVISMQDKLRSGLQQAQQQKTNQQQALQQQQLVMDTKDGWGNAK